jgi:hypothetical protein
MFQLQDLYKNLPSPIETEAHFVGGPFDGKVTKITVKKVLDESVFFIMRDKSIYRFREPYIFVFDGYQAPPAPQSEPTAIQKIKQKLMKWLLT